MNPLATSVCSLKLLVYKALSASQLSSPLTPAALALTKASEECAKYECERGLKLLEQHAAYVSGFAKLIVYEALRC